MRAAASKGLGAIVCACLAPVARALIAMLFVSPSPAAAVDETIFQAIAGPWLFGSEGSDDACVVSLSSTLQSGRHPVRGAASCAGDVATIARAIIWDLDAEGRLTFRDATGQSLIRLAEDPDGQYFEPGKPAGHRLVLMAANEGSERLIRPRDMAGRWEFQRPDGTPVCGIAFTTGLISPISGFRGLTVAPECDPGLKKLKLVKWHIEGALLVLVGTETADLTLVPKADGTFVKSGKEGGRPLVLARR